MGHLGHEFLARLYTQVHIGTRIYILFKSQTSKTNVWVENPIRAQENTKCSQQGGAEVAGEPMYMRTGGEEWGRRA